MALFESKPRRPIARWSALLLLPLVLSSCGRSDQASKPSTEWIVVVERAVLRNGFRDFGIANSTDAIWSKIIGACSYDDIVSVYATAERDGKVRLEPLIETSSFPERQNGLMGSPLLHNQEGALELVRQTLVARLVKAEDLHRTGQASDPSARLLESPLTLLQEMPSRRAGNCQQTVYVLLTCGRDDLYLADNPAKNSPKLGIFGFDAKANLKVLFDTRKLRPQFQPETQLWLVHDRRNFDADPTENNRLSARYREFWQEYIAALQAAGDSPSPSARHHFIPLEEFRDFKTRGTETSVPARSQPATRP